MNPIKITVIGAMGNSALYLLFVFVAGMVRGPALAWQLAIATAGVTYLSYILQMPRVQEQFQFDPTPRVVTPGWQIAAGLVAMSLSILLGVAAGLALVL